MINTRKTKKQIDRGLLITTIIFAIIGSILVFSASWPEGVLKFENGYYFFFRHLRSLAIGLVGMFLASKINYKIYKKFIFLIIIVSVVLNLLLFTKLGEDSLGSTRWLDFPLLPRFMPSDVLKIGSIMFMAYYLEGIGSRIRNVKEIIISVIFILIFVGIVFIRDMGSSMVMLASLGSMLIIAGMKVGTLAVLILLAIVFSVIGLQIPAFSYRLKRVTSFLDPFEYKSSDGLQLVNSLYALAMGSITGVGLGKGVQKFSYIPHVYNDFIFAALGEEFGLIGTFSVVVLFFIFLVLGLRIASKTKNKFGKYLAAGITTAIVFQAFIHIMVNIGLAPVTGITLPFISYGGTSLIITLYSTGILLNISKENER